MALRIRAFAPRDYPAAVALTNRAYPEYPETVAEWRHHDAHRDPKRSFLRFVAQVDGRMVGVASVSHDEHMYHPRKLALDITVDPARRGEGIGGALYDRLLGEVEALEPLRLWANVREDHAEGLRFVEKRGFVEIMREWENHLRPADFEPERWAGRIEAVEASGIRLLTYGQLAAEDPDFFLKLFDLASAVSHDVPSPDATSDPDYALWLAKLQANPNRIDAGYFIAVDGERYVGLSTLSRSQSADFLYTGLTGVRRDYRRRGIALALKLEAIAYCRAQGVPLVKTWNASTNAGMLSINAALGFRRQPAWISFGLDLREE